MKRTRMGNPLIALACVLWLGVDAWMLRNTQGSGAGALAWWVSHGRARDWLPRSWGQIVLAKQGTEMVLGDADGGSFDGLMRALTGSQGAVTAEYVIESESVGLWAPMTATHNHMLVLEPVIKTTPEAQEAAWSYAPAAREAYARWLESNGLPAIAAEARRTPRRESEVLWTGVARSGAATLVLVMLGFSAWSMPGWARERRLTKHRRSWTRGVCAECGYKVEALARCPECGGEREREESE